MHHVHVTPISGYKPYYAGARFNLVAGNQDDNKHFSLSDVSYSFTRNNLRF